MVVDPLDRPLPEATTLTVDCRSFLFAHTIFLFALTSWQTRMTGGINWRCSEFVYPHPFPCETALALTP
jgi:hypothetical protein